MADRNFYVAFAPLQGYTDCVYRRAHHDSAGGIDEYYTPFVRLEGGTMRRKDARDINPDRNAGVPTVPQIIAKNRDEFAQLCDEVESEGWRRIDLNMGCPFPMQVKAGRGCGLLPRKEQVAEIAAEMQQRPEVAFSVKMRLGQDDAEESLQLLPIINAMPLLHVTMHPRIGRQQYKGLPDLTRFEQFMTECRQPPTLAFFRPATHSRFERHAPTNLRLRLQRASRRQPDIGAATRLLGIPRHLNREKTAQSHHEKRQPAEIQRGSGRPFPIMPTPYDSPPFIKGNSYFQKNKRPSKSQSDLG